MDYNYHTHTYLCNHATGMPEEYIKRAIDAGVRYMGFSDHIPFVSGNGEESYYRISVKDKEKYFSEINALREKYADKIDIKIGFEMEYYPESFQKMLETARSLNAEYLILGQHYIDDENPDGIYLIIKTDSEEILNLYEKRITEGMKTGVFSYVAHPDIINFTGDDKIYEDVMRKICVTSRETNTPLEINLLGIRAKRNYPRELFWKIAGEEGAPVTFGVDSHTAYDAFDEASLKTAQNMVEKYKLNYIGKPELI